MGETISLLRKFLAYGIGLFLIILGIIQIVYAHNLPKTHKKFEEYYSVERARPDFGYKIGKKVKGPIKGAKEWRNQGISTIIFAVLLFVMLISIP
jgi:hypothetical protein